MLFWFLIRNRTLSLGIFATSDTALASAVSLALGLSFLESSIIFKSSSSHFMRVRTPSSVFFLLSGLWATGLAFSHLVYSAMRASEGFSRKVASSISSCLGNTSFSLSHNERWGWLRLIATGAKTRCVVRPYFTPTSRATFRLISLTSSAGNILQ